MSTTDTPTINPRSLGIEAQFLPESIEGLAQVKADLIAAGVSSPEAAGIVGWLVDKAAGRPDLTHASTRARYRRRLAELAGVELDPTTGRPIILGPSRYVRLLDLAFGSEREAGAA